ncbi:MAG: HEAT repeat domain-containing protein [Gemmatimonadaceae bacterium]
MTLLNGKFDGVAESAALLMTDVSYLPALVAQLEVRQSIKFRGNVIRTLGRMRDPRAFQIIVDALHDVATRPSAIQALQELGDARAVPYLQAHLSDTTELWREDDHGPMLRVCNLAERAIRHLSV